VTRIRSAFLLGAVFLAMAAGAFLIALLSDDTDPASTVSGFHRLALSSGGGSVELGSGTWVGYFESRQGDSVVPNFRAFVRDPQGAQVNVGNYSARPIHYAYRGEHGVAILQFHAAESGRYRIQLQFAGAATPGAGLALGRPLGESSGTSQRPAIVIGVITAVVGAAVIGWGLILRSRRPHVVSGSP
jgi:hypothetical protein